MERTIAFGLFRKFPSEAKARQEVDRLRLLDSVNGCRDSTSRGTLQTGKRKSPSLG